MRYLISCMAFIFGVVLIGWCQPVQAQECARQIASSSSELSYRSRGNRCEGHYRQQVSGRVNLRIVGYHANAVNLGAAGANSVLLRGLDFPRESSGQLKFVSTRTDDYYQMDTSSIRTDGSYSWPLGLLREVNPPLRARHLAGIMCVSGCLTGRNIKPTLAPILFPEGGSGTATQRLRLVIQADVSLQSVNVSIQDSSGQEVTRMIARDLPSGAATTYLLPELSAGYSDITIYARSQRGIQDRVEARLLIPNKG